MPGGKFPPIAFDADNRRFGGGDVMVRLYAEDGTTLEAEASPSGALDYALLPLSAAEWQSYPVPAILRVFLRGEQIGQDHVIDVSGLDGLYPDDVYVLHLE